MAQSPWGSYVARKLLSTALAPLFLDGTSKGLVTAAGGTLSALNLGAATLIFAGPARACRISIIAPGSGSGAFILNDAASIAAATAANQVWSMAYNASANVGGNVITLDFPVVNGLVLSAVPGAGTPLVAISYTA